MICDQNSGETWKQRWKKKTENWDGRQNKGKWILNCKMFIQPM